VTAFHDADETIGLPVASYAAVAVIGDALRATTSTDSYRLRVSDLSGRAVMMAR
jgi:hypothetical protein